MRWPKVGTLGHFMGNWPKWGHFRPKNRVFSWRGLLQSQRTKNVDEIPKLRNFKNALAQGRDLGPFYGKLAEMGAFSPQKPRFLVARLASKPPTKKY